MLPTTACLQLTDIDSRYNIYTVQNRSLFIKYSKERSLCKRHQDRTVATSNGRTFIMQTTPRPYGGDIERTNVHYANDTKTVRWRPRTIIMQTVPRPYGGDVERTASSFVQRTPLYLLRVPSPGGGSYEGNIERTASSFR